jgi:hypothetical protein
LPKTQAIRPKDALLLVEPKFLKVSVQSENESYEYEALWMDRLRQVAVNGVFLEEKIANE